MIDAMSKDQILSFLSENRNYEMTMFKTIEAIFDANGEGFTDEECKQILSSLLSHKKITWNGVEERIPFAHWSNFDLSLRVLTSDDELMANPKLASAAIQIFTDLNDFDRSYEGFRIILENLTETALPVHFSNEQVMRKFLRFAKVRRSQLLNYLQWTGRVKTGINQYANKRIVRAYYNCYVRHIAFFYGLFLLSIYNGYVTDILLIIPLFIISAIVAGVYFENFLFPYI